MKNLSALMLLILAAPVLHADEGPWRFTIGAHNVDPKSDNGRLAAGALAVEVGSAVRPTITAEYFANDHVGIELLAALPFKHDVDLNGSHAGEISHLPPVLSLQYHFTPRARISPYVGAGINFTWIHDEESAGPINGTQLDLDNSWGAALHAGVDFKMSNNWFIGIDARWIDIDADVQVNGADVGTVNVDPLVYGFYFGKRF